ncbi:MAG TPA: hypothetical protein VGR22_11015 [Thermomicrobiales bacterium]|nr:hypothetical protein [Thermomicrobiales bacterium]
MSHQSGDTQPSVAVLTRDLFFGMRIRSVLKQLGYAALLKKTETEFAEATGNTGCALGLIDFNGEVNWDAISPAIEARPDLAVIAFGAHTDTEAFRMARKARVTRVISNGAFSQQLPDLVERYAQRR